MAPATHEAASCVQSTPNTGRSVLIAPATGERNAIERGKKLCVANGWGFLTCVAGKLTTLKEVLAQARSHAQPWDSKCACALHTHAVVLHQMCGSLGCLTHARRTNETDTTCLHNHFAMSWTRYHAGLEGRNRECRDDSTSQPPHASLWEAWRVCLETWHMVLNRPSIWGCTGS